MVATGYCWHGWFQGNVAMVAILPLVHWILAAHTCHEATHATLSTNEHVNYWLQFTAHPIMFNVFVWIPQHLISHHQYTNDPNMDVDVHHFAPALLSGTIPLCPHSLRAAGQCADRHFWSRSQRSNRLSLTTARGPLFGRACSPPWGPASCSPCARSSTPPRPILTRTSPPSPTE